MTKWIYMLTNMPVRFADGRNEILRAGLGYELEAQEAQRFINFGLAVPMEEPKDGDNKVVGAARRDSRDSRRSKRLSASGRKPRGRTNRHNDKGRNAKA
jgi:hypothetical protein